MAKSKQPKRKKKFARRPRLAIAPEIMGFEIPTPIIDWLGRAPGKHCLVILQTPDGKSFSIELYDVPVTEDAIVGTHQDPVLQRAFNGAMANYNLQAAALNRTDYIV